MCLRLPRRGFWAEATRERFIANMLTASSSSAEATCSFPLPLGPLACDISMCIDSENGIFTLQIGHFTTRLLSKASCQTSSEKNCYGVLGVRTRKN
jgi:hypothetical protein